MPTPDAAPTAAKAKALMHQFQTGNVLAADCPSRIVLGHLTSRWGTLVMVVLATGTHRFSAVRRKVGGVSERMLAQTLQNLEADGLVRRVAFDVVPPHVEYSLTPLGQQAAARVVELSCWIETNLPQILQGKADIAA